MCSLLAAVINPSNLQTRWHSVRSSMVTNFRVRRTASPRRHRTTSISPTLAVIITKCLAERRCKWTSTAAAPCCRPLDFSFLLMFVSHSIKTLSLVQAITLQDPGYRMVHHVVCLPTPQLLLILIASTMLSWRGWLVTYHSDLPTHTWLPIPVLTGPNVEQACWLRLSQTDTFDSIHVSIYKPVDIIHKHLH